MPNLSLVRELVQAFEAIPVIDAHEHLPPERVRVENTVDVFTLFKHYTILDQVTSGLSKEDQDRLWDTDLSLESRWEIFEPVLENIRYGSYARPAFIAAKEFYGFDDINAETIHPISEAMAEQNTEGIYTRVLAEKCNIKAALTQQGRTDYDLDLMVPLPGPDDTTINPCELFAASFTADGVPYASQAFGGAAADFSYATATPTGGGLVVAGFTNSGPVGTPAADLLDLGGGPLPGHGHFDAFIGPGP